MLAFSRPMLIFTLRSLVALASAAACATFAAAADPSSDALSAYRLRAENADIFRLASPAPEPAAPSRPLLADKPYAELIGRAARDAALDPALVHAVIHVESRYNASARSPKGALGLMQVLPETAARYGVSDATRSVALNLSVGTRYLRDLMSMFDNRLDLVLAAYNAGEKAVERHGMRIPPYPETRRYVPAVLEKYAEWREPPAPAAPVVAPRIRYMPGTELDSAAIAGTRH